MNMADSEKDAKQVQERLKELTGMLKKIEIERVKVQQNMDHITKTQSKISQEGRYTPQSQSKLKGLYESNYHDSVEEMKLLRGALTRINEIRHIADERRLKARREGNREIFHRGQLMKMLQTSAQTLPLWVGEEKAPPLCGAIPADPSYIAKPGDMVAAMVKIVEGEEDGWILAEVVSFNPVTRKYEVDDIDEEQKQRHTLSRRLVVPLPLMKANPETDPDALFPKRAVVMALYPQTTCFYKALVNELPTSVLDDYELIFEDSSYADGYAPPLKVAQRYVIDIKERKKP